MIQNQIPHLTSNPHYQKGINEVRSNSSCILLCVHQCLLSISDLADEHCFVDLVKWEDEKGVKRELRIYSKIAHKWRQIATRLGFEPEEIESIDAECRTRYSRITAVLERWFENAKKLANASRYSQSWEGLIKLLEDTELGKVAVELQKALSSPKNSVRGNL